MMRISNLFSLSLCFWSFAIYADQNSDYENYSISSETSWIKVLIYPDGPLKHLGHHHVISHQNIRGSVQLASDPIDSIISLEFAVDEFTVDDYEMRMQEGGDFDGEVPQKDIDGTIRPVGGIVREEFNADQNIRLKQGYLETSNVSVFDELVNNVDIQKQYQLNVKLISLAKKLDEAGASLLKLPKKFQILN